MYVWAQTGGGGDFDAAAFSSCQGQIIRRRPPRSPPSPARNGLVPRLSSAAGRGGGRIKEMKNHTPGIVFFSRCCCSIPYEFSFHEFVGRTFTKGFSFPAKSSTDTSFQRNLQDKHSWEQAVFFFPLGKKHFRFHLFSLATTSYFVSFSFFGSPIYSRNIFFSSILGFSPFFLRRHS